MLYPHYLLLRLFHYQYSGGLIAFWKLSYHHLIELILDALGTL